MRQSEYYFNRVLETYADPLYMDQKYKLKNSEPRRSISPESKEVELLKIVISSMMLSEY